MKLCGDTMGILAGAEKLPPCRCELYAVGSPSRYMEGEQRVSLSLECALHSPQGQQPFASSIENHCFYWHMDVREFTLAMTTIYYLVGSARAVNN